MCCGAHGVCKGIGRVKPVPLGGPTPSKVTQRNQPSKTGKAGKAADGGAPWGTSGNTVASTATTRAKKGMSCREARGTSTSARTNRLHGKWRGLQGWFKKRYRMP